MKSNTICIVAGETSGDLLGGQLANAIKMEKPAFRLMGVGMNTMRDAGVDILIDAQQLAVVGFFEILRKINVLRRSMKLLEKLFKTHPPDLLILIDYPGFNLRLAAKAKAQGIKVMYYVSPQIWAWHYSRIKKIKRYVDHMAVLFPFEKNLYEKENVPVTYVGHPLVANLKSHFQREEALRYFRLYPHHPIIGILPGSRHQEIQRLLPEMLNAIKKIREKIPSSQFILPLAPHISRACLAPYDLTGIQVTQEHRFDAISLCDAAIVASGTVTLEVALLKIPMVIIYKVSALTAWIGRCIPSIKKIEAGEKCFGLCNIVAEERLMPEFLQRAITPVALRDAILDLLNNQTKRQYIFDKLAQLSEKLNSDQASQKVAKIALDLLIN